MENSKEKSQKSRILFMDDELSIARIAKAMITKLGYEITTINDGLTTIEEYKKTLESGKPYDLVILDLNMQNGFGGEEVMKEILKINSKARIILSSGSHIDELIKKQKEYGFYGIFCKPYGFQDIKKKLENSLQ